MLYLTVMLAAHALLELDLDLLPFLHSDRLRPSCDGSTTPQLSLSRHRFLKSHFLTSTFLILLFSSSHVSL